MTNGVGVKPTFLSFQGKAFHNGTAAAVPRSPCADAAHNRRADTSPQGQVTLNPDQIGLSGHRRVCVSPTPTPYALKDGACDGQVRNAG